MYIHTCIHAYVYTYNMYIHTCIHAYVYTYIHIWCAQDRDADIKELLEGSHDIDGTGFERLHKR